MQIKLETTVRGNYREVFHSFDQDLFNFLLPPGASVLKFDGSQKGDTVHLKFSFPLYAEWISIITDNSETDHECYFIDRGQKVPLGIKHWLHKHIVKKKAEQSLIVDDIEFSTGYLLLDILYYPFLYMAFLPRKRLYKKYFSQART